MKMVLECTALKGTGLKGNLTPDEDGYYTTVLGAYGVRNSAGLYYDAPSAIKVLENPNTICNRWMSKAILFGELNHPDPRPFLDANGNLDNDAYFARLRRMEPSRYAVHIRKVIIQEMRDDNGQLFYAVIGKVRPQGMFNDIVKQGLENPHSNMYFSVRSFTRDDMVRGIRYTTEVMGWDAVHEGGIGCAQKYKSPALESYEHPLKAFELEVTPDMIYRAQKLERKLSSITGNESDTVASLDILAKNLGIMASGRTHNRLHDWA